MHISTQKVNTIYSDSIFHTQQHSDIHLPKHITDYMQRFEGTDFQEK